MSPLEVTSTLQDHFLPQTTVTEPNFIQGIFSTLSNLKISSNFHFEFERGCQRYISPLAQAQTLFYFVCKPSLILVLEVYQSKIQSTIYTHVIIHCNTGFVLHSNILLMQPFRVSSIDVGCLAEPRNPHMLLCFILYAFTFASILTYST